MMPTLRKTILTILVLLACLLEAHSFGVFYWKFRNKVQKHRHETLKKELVQQSESFRPDPDSDVPVFIPDLFLEQPLDHFDPVVKGVYKQRHWVNTQYWRQPKVGPVFLYIGGEGALSSLAVQGGEYIKWAKEYGALLVAAEHRFYGASINEDGLKMEQLQFLSSQQGLADLAAFHSHISEKYNLTEANKWICFGGSYPGALSGWFRIKYPHLVHGAIASSAPVHARVNFEGYNDVVNAALKDPIVNGSIKCHNAVKEAFEAVDNKIAHGSLSDLERDFHTCAPLTSQKDVFQFVSGLADVFMGTVQYNEELPGHNVNNICINMTTPGASAYANLQHLVKHNLQGVGEECLDSSWSKFIAQLNDTSVTTGMGVGLRQWIYQTCTQFGYYQTCDANTTCIFSKYMKLEPNLEACKLVFGVDAGRLYSQVKFTNSYYGGEHPKGTRIVFVNGSIDPWHALGILKNQSSTQIAIFIPGTAHCADMLSDRPTDPPRLKQARTTIKKIIGEWLGQSVESQKKQNKDYTLYFEP